MRISNTRNVGRMTPGDKTHRSQGPQGKFQPGQSAPAAKGRQTGAAQSIRGVDALLAVQEAGSSLGGKKRKAVRRGNTMLDVLEEIRMDLLAGNVSDGRLQKLLELVREQPGETGNASLDGVLADIDLRARVELAKRGLDD